jgi:hypothetical protein
LNLYNLPKWQIEARIQGIEMVLSQDIANGIHSDPNRAYHNQPISYCSNLYPTQAFSCDEAIFSS